MSGFDFCVNSEELLTLKSELAAKIVAVESSLRSMENAVNSMGGQGGWVSEVYNILHEKFTSRKEAMEYAISYLKAYESTITAVAEKAEALSSEISNACAS